MGKPLHLVGDIHALFTMREAFNTGQQPQKPQGMAWKPLGLLLRSEAKLLGWSAGVEVVLTLLLVFAVNALFQLGR